MKKLIKKINDTIEKHAIGIEIGLFFVVLSELLHFLKYSKFSVDMMMVEVFALVFIVLILNLFQTEKDKRKLILKTAGLILLFVLIAFQIMFDHIFGEGFTCCEEVFDWILR